MNKRCIWLLAFIISSLFAQGQNPTIIKGVVQDAINSEPLLFATVVLVGANAGTTTDSIGKYSITTWQPVTKIAVSYLGYKPDTMKIIPGKTQTINFKLYPVTTDLKEMVFTAKKKDYKNKNNPAVELIKEVIEHKSKNVIESFDYYECQKYQKVVFGVTNISEKFKNRKILRKFKFIYNNIDTVKVPGKEVLPIYINEELSDYHYRKNPPTKKEVVKADKRVTYSGFIDDKGLTQFMNYIYQDVDIYKENIYLFTNQFVSPISGLAPSLYRFYIMDTVKIGDDSCYRLSFFPRNKEDFLFQGYLYITKDSLYAVRKIDMTINKDINLNFVKSMRITQTYEKKEIGWALVEDFVGADFGIIKSGELGIYGEKVLHYLNPVFNVKRSDDFYRGDDIYIKDDAATKSEEYWNTNRPVPLTNTEQGIYSTLDSLHNLNAYKRLMKISELIFTGFPSFGPVEIGDVNTFFGFNPVEGNRFKFGARTTNYMSKKFVLDDYVAYGTLDKKYKYNTGITYSLTNRNIYQFPVKSIRFSTQNDIMIPGQQLKDFQADDYLLNFKRGINDKWLYHKDYTFTYLFEIRTHFSYSIQLQTQNILPAGSLFFNPTSYNDTVNSINQIHNNTISVDLRYAPDEKFYQGKVWRVPIASLNPIFNLQYTAGLKASEFPNTNGLLLGQYHYQNIYASIQKRYILAPFGYTDILLEGSKLIGQVPYPLLQVARANQTYAYMPNSYNLMNFMEFVSDQYESIQIDHYFEGFIMNRIPLIRKLKLREKISFKAITGSLSNQNNPAITPGLFQFPTDKNGKPITYSLSKMPYMEAGVGIGNILKVFRVNLLRRLDYLDHPNVSQYGVRLELKIEF